MKIDRELLQRGFQLVETLTHQYRNRTSMTADQVVGKILYDLEEKFEATPELELISILALAAHFSERATIEYLKQEYATLLQDLLEEQVTIQLDLEAHEKAMFYLFVDEVPSHFFTSWRVA